MAGGAWIPFDWHGRTARAWLAEPLGSRQFELPEPTVRISEQAVAALRVSDTRMQPEWEPLARLLLRTEGIASSSIEGVQAPITDVALAELGLGGVGDAAWVADNLQAVTEATEHAGPLTIDAVHQWHTSLMQHSSLTDSMIGSFRRAPGWIGGTSPLDAAFVPAPAGRIEALMADLVEFANSDRFDAVTQAAQVHGQFETIHPYGDGNGRLGRILIGWVLRHRNVVQRLPPPMSVLIGRDPGGYLSGLHLFREDSPSAWIRWFANIADAAATQSGRMISAVEALLTAWATSLEDIRQDAAAHRVVGLLPQMPVLTAASVAPAAGVSVRSARSALGLLEQREVVAQIDVPAQQQGRPLRVYAAVELLEVVRSWTS